MYRTKTCGELRLTDCDSVVTLAGWVQRIRKMGGMTFVDVRDRYGITQIVFDEGQDAELCARANKLGREFCVQVKGTVSERHSKNSQRSEKEPRTAPPHDDSHSQLPRFSRFHRS